jgi:hypothetical protein
MPELVRAGSPGGSTWLVPLLVIAYTECFLPYLAREVRYVQAGFGAVLVV